MNADDARRLAALITRALAAFEALTPDQRLHHRHEQRISFAAGNVALSWHAAPIGTARRDVSRHREPLGATGRRAMPVRGMLTDGDRVSGPPITVADALARVGEAAKAWYAGKGNVEAPLAAAVQDLLRLERRALPIAVEPDAETALDVEVTP